MGILLKDHDLESSIALLLIGIKKFNNVTDNRITSDSWSVEHVQELKIMKKLLLDLQMKLIEI